ncbi:hypothetical protein D3C81_2194730 [compost metagenome]
MGAFEGCVHGEFIGRLVVVPAAYRSLLVAEDVHHRAALFQGLARACQFHLLEAVGDQESHSLAVQFCTHGPCSFP